jgi:hypothetical protein
MTGTELQDAADFTMAVHPGNTSPIRLLKPTSNTKQELKVYKKLERITPGRAEGDYGEDCEAA